MVAKKADNTDGFELIYKSVNDIQANEFHVATSIDGRQSQEFLEQTKKHLDKKAIKKQVDKLAENTQELGKNIKEVKKLTTSEWLKSFKTKINPRKDFPDGKFEKYVTGDDIQYGIKGGNEKIWADGIKIQENKVIDAKHNPGNFYTMENYQSKSFLYQDLEDIQQL
ncbi:hypothetical protein ACILD6_02485 [Capnocytophaga canimorsus]|uniref:Uncharacterized protein n=1 Tax=Capnocytophaga canimorsus TaxID=28188 RepID=A0A0B7IG48_9FLAO|nr:hypothetical protein [Capnocytophaga canimorsus]CEN50795.1 hypothetical protein CCAN11_2200020 [Capnocytophaga canimorsus]